MNESKRSILKLGLALSGGPMILAACGGGGDAATTTGGGTAPSSGIMAGGRNAEVAGNVAANFNSASGNLGGINVSAGGRSTATDGGGSFRLDDVTPGPQAVTFESERENAFSKQKQVVAVFNAETVRGSIMVDIPEGGKVDFQNVRIQGNIVVADQIVITNAAGDSTTISGGTLPAPDTSVDVPNSGANSPNTGTNLF